MIERHWKGIAKPQSADAYIKHLLEDTFPKLKTIQGFVNARILKRAVDTGMEFLIVTAWESYESIKQFAGSQVDVAVIPALVQEMMTEFDRHVSHYDVLIDMNRNHE